MPSRRLPAFAATLAAALVLVPTAAAKVWFRSIEAKTFSTGSVVTTEISGCPVPCPIAGARVYLATGARSGSTTSPLPRTRLLGVVDRLGILRFRAPAVGAGRYHLVAHFRGAWLRASGAFRIAPRR